MKLKILPLLLVITLLSLTVVVASETIEATTNDTYYFYAHDSLASQDGYAAAIFKDGTVYYLDSNNCNKLSEYSTVFKEGIDKQPTSTKDAESNLDKNVKFTFKEGKVGMNEHAKIIDTLTLDK